jgi:hypothetical protein
MVNAIKDHKRIAILGLLAMIVISSIVIILIRVTRSASKYEVDGGKIILEKVNVSKDANNMYYFTANLSVKDQTLNIKSLNMTLKDSKNANIITLTGYVNQEVQKGEIVEITAVTDKKIDEFKNIAFNVNYNTDATPDEGSGE